MRITAAVGTPMINPGRTNSNGDRPSASGLLGSLAVPPVPSAGGGVSAATVNKIPEAVAVWSDGAAGCCGVPVELLGPGVGTCVASGEGGGVAPGKVVIGKLAVGRGRVGSGSDGVGMGSEGSGIDGTGRVGKGRVGTGGGVGNGTGGGVGNGGTGSAGSDGNGGSGSDGNGTGKFGAAATGPGNRGSTETPTPATGWALSRIVRMPMAPRAPNRACARRLHRWDVTARRMAFITRPWWSTSRGGRGSGARQGAGHSGPAPCRS